MAAGTTYGKATFSLGHIAGGKLYYDGGHGPLTSIGQAIAQNRSLPFVQNRVIIESRPMRRYGKIAGTVVRYFSPIDGTELKLDL